MKTKLASPALQAFINEYRRWAAPPPAPRSIIDFAFSIKIPDPDGGAKPPIPYNPREHAPQMAVLHAIHSDQYLYYVVLGPVQDGKTLVVMTIPILYCLTELAQNIVYATPDMLVTGKQWHAKIKTGLIVSGLGHFLPKSGVGSATGGIGNGDILLNNGARAYLMGAGGTNESAQSAITARFSFLDERDAIKERLASAIRKRTNSFDMDARDFSTSTLKKDAVGDGTTGSAILSEYEESTRCRIAFPCYLCGAYQLWDWEQVRCDYTDDDTVIRSARIECKECRKFLTEQDRRRMVTSNKGKVVSLLPDGTYTDVIIRSRRFGLLWWAMESPLKSLGKLCLNYRAAKIQVDKYHNHEPMRQFYRDELVRIYEDASEDLGVTIGTSLLSEIAKRSTYSRGEIPVEATFLTMSVDCQLRTHYWMAEAFWQDEALNLCSAVIDWGHVSVCSQVTTPTPEQRHASLDDMEALAARGWTVQGKTNMEATKCSVDTAFKPDEIRPWVAKHNKRWLSIRGAGRDLVQKMAEHRKGHAVRVVGGAIEIRQQEGQIDRFQGFADATTLGDEIATSWRNGLARLPKELEISLERSLLGVKRGPKGWEQIHDRHDYWDLKVYNRARAMQHFNRPKQAPRTYGQVGTFGPTDINKPPTEFRVPRGLGEAHAPQPA